MANTKTSVILNFTLILALLLVVSLVEGRRFDIGSASSAPECDSVVGVQSGDTCFEVAQTFNLTTEFFNAINPNLNCTALFIGQWLCVAGAA